MMLWLAENKDALEAISFIATTLGIAVALVAGLIAWSQYKAQKDYSHMQWQEGRWAQARRLYEEVQKIAMEYPEYSNNFWQKRSVLKVDRVRYEIFMSLFLLAIEDILELDKRSEWVDALACDLGPHKGYLEDEHFREKRKYYFPPVIALMDRVAPIPDLRGHAHA